MTLETPVTELKGVGAARAKALAKLGIATVGDLVRHLPRAYQDRGNVTSAAAAGQSDIPVSLVLTVSAEPSSARLKRGLTMLKFRAFDETGSVQMTYFNQPFLRDVFHTGATFRFFGKVERKRSVVQMTNPIAEACRDGDTSSLRDIVPVYALTTGISQKFLCSIISEALSRLPPISDFLPPSVVLDNKLATENTAIRAVHFPADRAELDAARRRLTFDELYVMALAMAMRRSARTRNDAPALTAANIAPLLGQFGFELTGAQKRCISEIAADMSKSVPMKRLLCGDVGSGKTAVAAAAAYICARSGRQAALMAPTEILAKQHFAFFAPLWETLGLRCELLCGSMTAAEKKRVSASLASGEVDLAVGTHALITEKVSFADLALVITDEQHRFGVSQRSALEEKSRSAHTLVMSATPIPRTLTLTKYGELDVSRLDEMPAGRKKIGTFRVDSTYRERLYGFIEKQANEGHQTYVVCPAIEEKEPDDPDSAANLFFGTLFYEKTPILSATKCAEDIAAALPGVRVGCVHGKMKTADKDAVMGAFSRGELDVLVATTVIEVGINVPAATLMVVENAERFGLAQLHQLRGRVGRGSAKSWCILVSDSETDSAKDRLKTMEDCSDGFEIAEADLRQRGPGDFFGSGELRQSGNYVPPLAAACSDEALMEAAANAAGDAIAADPELTSPQNAPAAALAARFIENVGNTVN